MPAPEPTLVAAPPDFARIEEGDPVAARDAVWLLWALLNQEMTIRAQVVQTLAPESTQDYITLIGAYC